MWRRAALFSPLLLLMVVLVGRGGDQSFEPMTTNLLARLRGPLPYDHPALLSLIAHTALTPPSPAPYALTRDRTDLKAKLYNIYAGDVGYVKLQNLLAEVFVSESPGFFVEAGAMDGEFLSNTLYMERYLGWSGLLVEADTAQYNSLLNRHRRVWSCHCCLSPHPYPHTEVLASYSTQAKSSIPSAMAAKSFGFLMSHEHLSPLRLAKGGLGEGVLPRYEGIQCYPLASLLLALNKTRVNFISLDVEGAELSILQTFPWHKITVDVWLVEYYTPPSLRRNVNSKTDSPNATEKQTSNNFNHDKLPLNPKHMIKSSTSHDLDNSGSSEIVHEGEAALLDLFRRQGYDLHPTDVKTHMFNYLFVRRESSIHRRLGL